METFSALLALCAGISPVTVEFPSQRPVTRSFDVFFGLRLKNGWVNNRDAGDLRRHCAHCDVTVMKVWFLWTRGISLARYFRYICVLYINLRHLCFSYETDFWFGLWSIKQILWWINMHKSKNFGEVTTTEVKIIKTAETWIRLVSNFVYSRWFFCINCHVERIPIKICRIHLLNLNLELNFPQLRFSIRVLSKCLRIQFLRKCGDKVDKCVIHVSFDGNNNNNSNNNDNNNNNYNNYNSFGK